MADTDDGVLRADSASDAGRQRQHRRLNVPLPPKLEMQGSMATNWKKFARMWRNYEIVTRLSEETDEFRTAKLLTCIGSEALDVYEGLPFADDNERQNVTTVLKKFEEFCLGEMNETYESYLFYMRSQDVGESVESYIATLRKMAKTCNFGQVEDRLIRDRVVMGIRDEALRSKLLQIRQLDLKMCIDCCRAFESSQLQTRAMNKGQHQHQEDIHWVSKKPQKKAWTPRKPLEKKKCGYCGKTHVPDKQQCPAFGKECSKCHRSNHFAAVCKQTKQQAKVHAVCMPDDDYILMVEEENKLSRTVCANMIIGGQNVNFQIDSGATANVLPESEYVRVTDDSKLVHLQHTQTQLIMYNKTVVLPTGQRILDVKNPKNNENYKVRFIVVRRDCKPILGLRAVQHMQLITVNSANIAVVETAKDEDVMSTYQDVFTGEGRLEGHLHLVTDDAVPPVKLPCRKWPLSVREMSKVNWKG